MVRKTQGALAIFLLLVGLIAVNIIGQFIHGRLDLTAEKKYSISLETQKRVANLKENMLIKVYLDGDFPPGFQKLKGSVIDLMEQLVGLSNGKIAYQLINPSTYGSDAKGTNEFYKELYRKGLLPTDLQVNSEGGMQRQIIWPGALVIYKGVEVPVNFLRGQSGAGAPQESINESEENLEFEFANAIRKASVVQKPKIAFITGQGELPKENIIDLVKELSNIYEVEKYNLGRVEPLPADYKCIIIARPDSAFSDWEKFKLDQYVMNGGRVLWMINGTKANMDSMGTEPAFMATPNEIGLTEMLFKYGVRINSDIVQDLRCSQLPVVVGTMNGKPQQKLFPWFYFPLVTAQEAHPIAKNLDPVQFQFASTIDLIENDIKKTILLQSSRYTKVQYAPARVNLGMVRLKPDVNQFNKPFQNLAVLLEGEFESSFKSKVFEGFAQKALDSLGIKPIKRSAKTKMIVIGDGEIGANYVSRNSGNIYPLGFDRFTGQMYGNKAFMLNCIDYLCDEDGLINIRNREISLRLLNQQQIKSERLMWQLFNVGAPVMLLILVGIWYNRKRKKRFA